MRKNEKIMLQQTPEIREIGRKLKILGEQLRDGTIELKIASELANIYGKELKAQQLVIAERIFMNSSNLPMLLPA